MYLRVGQIDLLVEPAATLGFEFHLLRSPLSLTATSHYVQLSTAQAMLGARSQDMLMSATSETEQY